MPYCGRCGAKNPDDAVFCGACGQRLISIAPPEQPQVYTPPAPTPIFTSPQDGMNPPAPTFNPPPQDGIAPPAPTFNPPPQDGIAPPAPTFNPPQDGMNPPASTFNPPPQNGTTPPAPTFNPPQNGVTPPAPTFNPPPQNGTTPPAPTFNPPPQNGTTPPAPTFNPPPQSGITPPAPTFNPPPQSGMNPPAPTFNPPPQNGIEVPTFNPPPQNGINQSVPTFTPPQNGINQPIPTFTPPQGGFDKPAPTFNPPAPTFTPPAPTFTPPRVRSNGPACYYHPDEPAVAKCARCGKLICQDCFDNYGVSAGEYEGHALCFDCCQQLVAENIAELKRNKRVIKFQFILSLIGIVIGFIFGCAAGGPIAGLVYGCVGGVFLSAVKAYCSMLWEAIKIAFSGQFGIVTVISLVVQSAIIIFKCIGATISNTYHYIVYLKQTSGFIESDTAALRQMQDYMEYTLIRNMNRGVDIETLLKQDSRLADNSYAHMVQSQGEAQAEANLRGCVATINENGEIIRSFAA